MNRVLLVLLIGFIFHVVYLYSIFDIYFKSPLVQGLVPVARDPLQTEAPASRLILIVADGLRADKLFEMVAPGSRAPFLRNVVEERGRWGVSHTRVPTESRPGHVAVIAGFYEDVSAVTKGWKENPVEFDSLFNRSRSTFAFGSPDILPMFGGPACPHVHMEMYAPDAEDFAANSTDLDQWVFDRLARTLHTAASADVQDPVRQALRANQTVIFLHLLGLDTAGHAKRPYSRDYLDNIRFVDRGIREVERQVEEFYGHDRRTAYVFTADHGMSDKGSHGDGETANTETPLIAWGAGIRLPSVTVAAAPHSDPARQAEVGPSPPWQLDSVERVDVAQADIAPLLATLIGVPIPVNSVGVLPTEYLLADAEFRARALTSNARVLAVQLAGKEAMTRRSSIGPFSPWDSRAESHDPALYGAPGSVAVRLRELDRLLSRESNQFDVAAVRARDLIRYSLAGLHYYQTYDWPVLMSVVSIGYLGWICFAGLHSLVRAPAHRAAGRGRRTAVSMSDGAPSGSIVLFSASHGRVAAPLFGLLALVLWSQRAPPTYYAYVLFPVVFWTAVATDLWPVVSRSLFAAMSREPWACARAASVTLGTLQLAVAGYFDRRLFGVSVLIMAVWLNPPTDDEAGRSRGSMGRVVHRRLLNVVWYASVLLVALFTWAPLSPGDRPVMVFLGSLTLVGAIAFVRSTGNLFAVASNDAGRPPVPAAPISQGAWSRRPVVCALTAVASGGAVLVTSHSLSVNAGLPLVNQVWSWAVLLCSVVVPFVGPVFRRAQPTVMDRVLMAVQAFAGPFVLLSVAYETLFFSCLVLALATWVQVMSLRSQGAGNPPSLLELALSYLLFLYLSFFGTGNVASISSFEISSTYRFTTVFNPFLMGALLLWKVFIPFIVVASAFGAIVRTLAGVPDGVATAVSGSNARSSTSNGHGVSPGSLVLLVVALSDVMTLNFFFMVEDEGSWLAIGVSISHFALSNAMIIFQILLWAVGLGIFYNLPNERIIKKNS